MLFILSLLLTDFPYTWETPGAVQEIKLPPGQYKIELWGAQGGNGYEDDNLKSYGGKGAYTVGQLKIRDNIHTMYCRVGGRGETGIKQSNKGGWNGGGNSGEDTGAPFEKKFEGSGGGGGATDIRYDDSVDTRIMVAAGGSGSACDCNGAPGGTISGYFAEYSSSKGYFYSISQEVNQIKGDPTGRGEDGDNSRSIPGSGGGGGWRGGKGMGWAVTDKHEAVAHSGSSYISGYPGCTPDPNYKFTNVDMKDGLSEKAKEGNGKILVTLLYKCSDNCIDCSSADKCNKCETGSLMYRQSETSVTCHKTCPTGTYKNGNECSKCLDSCSACSSQMYCTKCNAGYYFYQNLCYATCPDGTYQSVSSCLKCNTGCSKCHTTAKYCTECQEGYYFKDNRCYLDCSDLNDKTTFYGKNLADKTCSRCSIEFCNSCSEDYTKCTSCIDSHFLNENKQCQIKPTSAFTKSDSFTKSNSFTPSSSFTKSSSFSESTDFSKSFSFTKSSSFSTSNEFTLSTVFSESFVFSNSQTLPTRVFTKSNAFTHTNDFTESNEFTKSTDFTQSNHFSPSLNFSESFTFTPSQVIIVIEKNTNLSGSNHKTMVISSLVAVIAALAIVTAIIIIIIVIRRRRMNQSQPTSDQEMVSTCNLTVTNTTFDDDADIDSDHDIADPFNVSFVEYQS